MGKLIATSVKPVREPLRRLSGFSVFLILLLALAALPGLFPGAAFGMTTGAADDPSPACQPDIAVSSATPRWDSYGDYLDHDLTVEETVQNLGSCSSCSLHIDSILTDNGVSVNTPLPIDVGSMPTAASRTISVSFHVPAGVARFHMRLVASCGETGQSQPPAASAATIDPQLAYANDGCPEGPVLGQDGRTLPQEQGYGARRFTVSLREPDGSPAAGKTVKWYLTNDFQFRILDSTVVTDSSGRAYAEVIPPMYFVCITPYFDYGQTDVTARSQYGDAQATFLYTRCAPPGETPPWAAQ